MAHRNSDRVAIAELGIDLMQSDFTAALQKFLPNISYAVQRGNGRFIYPESNTGFFSGTRDYNIKTDTFAISEDLSLHKILADQVSSWKKFKSESAKFKAFLHEITLLIVQKHLDIVIAGESLQLMKMIEQDLGHDLKNAKVKDIFESIEPSRYIAYESKHDDASARVLHAKMQLEALSDEYEVLTKSKPTNLELLAKFRLPATNFDDFLSIVMDSNKNIEAKRAIVEMLSAAKFASFADIFLPRLSLSYQDQKIVYAFLNGARVSDKRTVFEASFNLYDRGDKINTAVKASIYKRINEREFELLKKELQISAKKLWSNHHSFLILEKSKKKDVQIEDRNLQIASERLKKGSISFIDYLKIKVSFYNAKINYLNTYREFVLNYYTILSLC